MKTVFRSSIIITVVWALAACATTSSPSRGGRAPGWVSDKDSAYPPEQYLAEVGEGDNLNAAKSSAAGSIAQIFRTRIQVDNQIRTRYTEISGEGGEALGMLSQTDVDQNIQQTADESLTNLRFGESWTNDMGRVYTIAYLDRAETGRLYRQRIIENDGRVSELLDRARTQDDPLRRFAFMDAALVTAEVNRVLTEQLEIINMPMAASIMHPYRIGDIRAARADQGSALKVRIEVYGDPEGRVGAVLTDWVTSRGFTAANDGDMFLSAVVNIVPVQLNNDYENLNWELNLTLMDVYGYPAVSLPVGNRASGISATAAEARAYGDMTKTVERDFDREFSSYLNGFLDK